MSYSSGQNPGVDMSITFVYFRDIPKAMDFYENIMGFSLAIDQGHCKIYQTSLSGYVGLVDEARGFHKANDIKPIILCYRVPDVDLWYKFIKAKGVELIRDIKTNTTETVRAFFIKDPEGHVIEIQTGL